ncbi:tetratricopeptide repeat protein [Sulfitobacter sp.]|uniref:tetratricopeptide repeat protein n=1 Tax=Sulfitobacter sp. TaxID=1903071 RepID=UPI0030033DC8
MTNQTPIGLVAAVLVLCSTNTVYAQNIDGIYQPKGSVWSCSPDQIGMDGGALAIQNGVLDGVENRCDLTAPVSVGNGTKFTAVCAAEGSTYSEPVTISPTSDGVKIEQEGSTIFWSRCDNQQTTEGMPQPMNGRWVLGYGQGVSESSTSDRNGNTIIFSCYAGEEGELYVDIGGKPIAGGPVEFNVDGETFSMTAWADDGRINTECAACGDNYTALWSATAAGSLMTVRASDSQSAAFSLNGSRDALGDVVCTPIVEAVPEVIFSADTVSVSNYEQSEIDPVVLLEAQRRCDRLASDPLDPNRRSAGIDWADMDHEDARRWCNIAAYGDRNDLTSMANFARALAEVDAVQAGRLVQELSASGYPMGHYYMGVFYATGENGFQQSNSASTASFESALELGIPRAANRLGLYYARIGNTNAALRYWRIGAEMGDESSVANIAALQAKRDGQRRLIPLFGNIPRSYPTYDTAVGLLKRYADICTREQLSYCSNICRMMLGDLIAEYSSVSRDSLVHPYWDGCVGAVIRDTQ